MRTSVDDDPQSIRYRDLGMGGKVGVGLKPALLLVDFQCAFTRGVLASERTADALSAAAEMLTTARALDVDIVHSHVVFDEEQDIGTVWRAKGKHLVQCVRGHDGVAIDDRVTPADGELVLEKLRASAFFGTDLHGILQKRGIDTIVVCGTSTSGCVRATVVDGAALDYRITVVEEAVDDRAPDSHRAALVDLHAKYADVVSLPQAQALLRSMVEARGGESGHTS